MPVLVPLFLAQITTSGELSRDEKRDSQNNFG